MKTPKKSFYSIIVIVGLVILSPRVSFGVEQFSRDLSFGFQQDLDVTKLQEFLSDEGLYSGPITGNFFSLTLKAVKAFQSREGIMPAAGYFGPKTMVRANTLLGAQVQAFNQQAVAETGQDIVQSVIPQTTNNSASNIQSQLEVLVKQIALLQQQLNTQQQNQTNTSAPVSTSNKITTPVSPNQNSASPTLKFNQISQNVNLGVQGLKISWTSAYVESCSASGAWNGSKSTNGEEVLSFSQTGNYTYTLTCVGKNGESVTESIVIKVIDTTPKITFSFNGSESAANTYTTKVGDAVRLGWSTQYSYGGKCTASGDWGGEKSSGNSENVTFSQVGTFNYILTCVSAASGEKGTNTATIIVIQ
jgi:VCBS repeat-containing protein